MSIARVPVKLLLDPGHFLALGLGAGLLKPAPGTWGSALALLLWWALLSGLNMAFYLAALGVAAALGAWLCGRTSRALGVEDHPAIVWDEFAGLWIACLALPAGWLWPLLAFALFRGLDILKPWPIGWLDRRVKGGWGIMLDDLVAGLMALVLLQLLALVLAATGTI